MRTEACTGCGARLAYGLAACPRCRAVTPAFAARLKRDKENAMPRITVASGTSNAAASPGEVGHMGDVLTQAVGEQLPPVPVADAVPMLPTSRNKASDAIPAPGPVAVETPAVRKPRARKATASASASGGD